MIVITMLTEGAGRFYRRTLPFSEIEIEYESSDFSVPIEMDIRNIGLKAHLELTADSATLAINENNRIQDETVFFIEVHGRRYHPSQLDKIDKAINWKDDTNLLK